MSSSYRGRRDDNEGVGGRCETGQTTLGAPIIAAGSPFRPPDASPFDLGGAGGLPFGSQGA